RRREARGEVGVVEADDRKLCGDIQSHLAGGVDGAARDQIVEGEQGGGAWLAGEQLHRAAETAVLFSGDAGDIAVGSIQSRLDQGRAVSLQTRSAGAHRLRAGEIADAA